MKLYLRVANVFEDRIDLSDLKSMHFDPNEFERYRLRDGDVLLNEGQTPELLGRPAIYREHHGELAFTNSLIRFQPRDDVDPRWALAVFRHHMHSGRFKRESRITTNIAHLSLGRLRAVEFPVPPLDEQLRIVAILEDHLSRLDAGLTGVRTGTTRLAKLRETALASAIAEARASEGGTVHHLGELARIGSGMTPLRGNKAFYDGGTIPWITSGDLHQGRITEAKHFVTRAAVEQTSLKMVPAGSLLIAMYGEGKTRGTAAELAIDATTNQACASVTLHDPALRPWVRLVLDANYVGLRRLAAGGVQPNLKLSLVRSIEVPLPLGPDRERVVRYVAELNEAGANLQTELDKAERRGASLRRSLLAAAFSGCLTGSATKLSGVEEMIEA